MTETAGTLHPGKHAYDPDPQTTTQRLKEVFQFTVNISLMMLFQECGKAGENKRLSKGRTEGIMKRKDLHTHRHRHLLDTSTSVIPISAHYHWLVHVNGILHR